MAQLTSSGIRFASIPAVDELNSRRGIFPTSTAWVFYQASAPTGWTKVETQNNKALRVVSGSGGGSGGTNSFTTTMSSFTLGGTLTSTNATGGTGLSAPQIPGHTHPTALGLAANPANFNPNGSFIGWSGGDVARSTGWTQTSPGYGDAGTSPAGIAHSHPFSGTATVSDQTVGIEVQYIDIIVCTFDG